MIDHQEDRVSARTVQAQLSTHEAVCAERYGMFVQRITRLEKVLLWAAASLLTGMGGIIIIILAGK